MPGIGVKVQLSSDRVITLSRDLPFASTSINFNELNVMLSRRQFLKSALPLSLLPGAAMGSQSSVQRSSLEIKINGLGAEFEGYKIAFVTDIHHGVWLPQELLEQAIQLVSQERVDLLLLGGDYIGLPDPIKTAASGSILNKRFAGLDEFNAPVPIFENLGAMLSKVAPPDGIVGVYGNHDLWLAPHASRKLLPRHGVKMLVNQSFLVKRGGHTLHVYGLDELWTGIPRYLINPSKAPHETRILLAHNPDSFSSVLDSPEFEFDLGLAGHTHAGQVKLPLLGALSYNIMDSRLGEGVFQNGQKKCFTSRGIGTVEIPIRINCPPEVTIFTLQHA